MTRIDHTSMIRSRPGLLVLPLLLLALQGCGPSDADATPQDAMQRPAREVFRSQAPQRPYSEAVRAGNLFFLSGKVGASGETRAMSEGRTAAEVHNIMESFQGLLTELGLEFGDVVSATVFLADIADYGEMNEAYGSYFGDDPPARETVAVKDIVGGAAVEISFIAVDSGP